jgi:hypothetical protein
MPPEVPGASSLSGAPWMVFGRVGGNYLPKSQIRIGPITLGPMPYAGEPCIRVGRPRITAVPTPDFCIAEGSDVRVRSQCYFWGPVDAGSAAEALEIFRTSDLPLLQAALSIRFENPYRLELMWAERGRVREAASSANVSVIFWVAQEPNDEWIARANADYLSLEAD